MDVTQTKLAELAGVSQNTVHRALYGMPGVSAATRELIHQLAAEHGYRVNTAARNMRTGRTGQVGVLVLDNPARRYVHPALFELTWGVNSGLEAGGYVTTLMRLTDVDRPDSENTRIFREHLLDGVIVANMLPEPMIKKVEQLVPRCVWLDTNVWRDVDCVRRDEVEAGRLAGRALVDAGHRSIVYFNRPEPTGRVYSDQGMRHFSGDDRIAGLRQAAEPAGVKLIGIEVPHLEDYTFANLVEHLKAGAGVFINRLSEARRLAAHSCHLGGLRWGVDYSISSADDAADLDWWWPELTRVRFDRLAMGQAAAEMMVARLNDDAAGRTSRVITGGLVTGSTVRSN